MKDTNYDAPFKDRIILIHANYRYNTYAVCDDQYGSLSPNGTWTGVVRDLLDRRAHLAIGNLGQNYDREQVIEFLPVSTSYGGAGKSNIEIFLHYSPIVSVYIGILLKKSSRNVDMFTVYLKPFTMWVWICIFIYVIGAAFILQFISHFKGFSVKFILKNSIFPQKQSTEDQLLFHKSYNGQVNTTKAIFIKYIYLICFTHKMIRRRKPLRPSKKEPTEDKSDVQNYYYFSFTSGFWFALGALLQQGLLTSQYYSCTFLSHFF